MTADRTKEPLPHPLPVTIRTFPSPDPSRVTDLAVTIPGVAMPAASHDPHPCRHRQTVTVQEVEVGPP
jgi:hypothetical protein